MKFDTCHLGEVKHWLSILLFSPIFASVLAENPDGPGYISVGTEIIGWSGFYVGGQPK
jgi:hypothetical protein